MGLLQGIVSFLRNAAKKLVEAMFGWAVQSLFGTPRSSEKAWLSAVVGAAAAWPILLFGIPFPKITAFVLTLVPIPSWVPAGVVRLFWIGATLAVPVAVGIALVRRGDRKIAHEPFWKKAAHGLPVTVGLGSAFVVAIVTAPIRRLAAMFKGWKDEHVPLLVEIQEYGEIAEEVRATLERGGLPVERARPPWLLTAPSRVLRLLGGRMLRTSIPEKLEFFRSASLEVAVHPNGVTLQGDPPIAARAHGLIAERATLTKGLQATDPAGQKLEKTLKEIWSAYGRDPDRLRHADRFADRVEEVSDQLAHTFLAYDDWQVVYREILQVSRAVHGRPPLLERAVRDALKESPRRSREGRGSRSSRRPLSKAISPKLRSAVNTQGRLSRVVPKMLTRLVDRMFGRRK